VESAAIRVEAERDDPERLALMLQGGDVPLVPTHWSFGQLASLVGASAVYLRQLPAPLAGINLQYGLTSHRAELVKTLEVENGRVELRAITGPDYGRIYDHELVAAVQRIAGNGIGDTRWKVPGVLNWSTGIYNPRVYITQTRPRCMPRIATSSYFWLTTSIRSRQGGYRTARPTSTFAAFIVGTPSRRKNAWHCELLSPGRLPEPQSLGCRGLRGDHYPPLEICRLTLRP
jgi:hypothetical protein